MQDIHKSLILMLLAGCVAETRNDGNTPEWQQNGAFLAFPGGSDTKGPVPTHIYIPPGSAHLIPRRSKHKAAACSFLIISISALQGGGRGGLA